MAKFEVILKNEKTRQYDRMALFIILLNIAILVLTAFYAADNFSRIGSLVGAAISALALIAGYRQERQKKNTGKFYYRVSFTVIIIAWIALSSWWAAGICLALAFLYQASQRPLTVGINEEAVLYPSFPKRAISWNDLNNLILKDGLLTIDFKNNKILQSEIINSPVELNEKEFNDFCRKQLH